MYAILVLGTHVVRDLGVGDAGVAQMGGHLTHPRHFLFTHVVCYLGVGNAGVAQMGGHLTHPRHFFVHRPHAHGEVLHGTQRLGTHLLILFYLSIYM